MGEHNPVMAHGAIEEVFPDVFFVQGTYKGEFFGSPWTFSRNMTIVREGDALTLLNVVRLDEAGLAALEALGRVAHVVRLGSLHDHDYAFYVDRYGATMWALPGMPPIEGAPMDRDLSAGETPFGDCEVFTFETPKLPECILLLKREGGIAIACDALQNWVEKDALIDESTAEKMAQMGFFTPANIGPAWMHFMEPKAEDFARLKQVGFAHALCGHGEPLRGGASERYAATFQRMFDV